MPSKQQLLAFLKRDELLATAGRPSIPVDPRCSREPMAKILATGSDEMPANWLGRAADLVDVRYPLHGPLPKTKE